jgi:hypothetical protein
MGRSSRHNQREQKTAELNGVPIVTAAPAATDVTVEALAPMFAAAGVAGKDHAENTLITSWFYGIVFFLVCLFSPWIAQTYFFETLDPDGVRKEYFEARKEYEMRKAAKQAGKAERDRIRAKARAIREADKRQAKQDAQEAKRQAKEENQRLKAEPKPGPVEDEPSPWVDLVRTVPDDVLDKFLDFGLQPSNERTKAGDFFNCGRWQEFCRVYGVSYGTQAMLTSRLKTRFKWDKKGGVTWFYGVEIKPETAKPKLKIVV